MERYCDSFTADVNMWEDIIKKVENLPFECIRLLGHGEWCSVYSIAPIEELDNNSDGATSNVNEEEKADDEDLISDNDSDNEEETHWTEKYFDMNDVEGTISDSDSSSCYDDMSDSDDESEDSDCSEEWTNLDDSDVKNKKMPHVVINTPSPMGPVEVVAKRFTNLKEDVCYQACDPHTKAQLKLESSSHKYLEWMQGCNQHVDTKVLTKKITDTTACYNGFVTESLCHLLITDLVARSITPHITMAFRAMQCGNTGYLIQERISSTLEEIMEFNPNLGATEMAAFYFQIIFTLHIVQATCRMKHHDLHTSNVFIKVIDDDMVWRGQKLKEATHFSYKLDDNTVVYLPNNGHIVKLGDFGMSSLDVYGRRIQKLDMETYPTGTGWGDWTPELNNCEGYDAQMLVGAPPFEEESWRMNDEPTRVFLRHLRRVVQGPNGKLTRSRLRPMPGHVSTTTPLEVVRKVFIEEPGQGYDFRGAPQEDNAVVICMSDLGDLIPDTPTDTFRKRKRRVRKNSVVPGINKK